MTADDVTLTEAERGAHGTRSTFHDLHENARAYSLANAALREAFGYTHSTTLAWLIKQRFIGPLHPVYDRRRDEVLALTTDGAFCVLCEHHLDNCAADPCVLGRVRAVFKP